MPKHVTKTRNRRQRKSQSMYAKGPATPLGNTFKYTTRYYETDLEINPAAGGLATTIVYSANGLYDPNITGVGHQPLGFDELMVMYDHYTVIGSRIRVNYNNRDPVQNVTCGVYISDVASVQTDARVIIENGLGKYKQLSQLGANNSGSLVLKHSPKTFFNQKNIVGEKDYSGTASANPTEQSYFHIWAANPAATDGGIVRATVEIEYIAMLTEPNKLTLS